MSHKALNSLKTANGDQPTLLITYRDCLIISRVHSYGVLKFALLAANAASWHHDAILFAAVCCYLQHITDVVQPQHHDN